MRTRQYEQQNCLAIIALSLNWFLDLGHLTCTGEHMKIWTKEFVLANPELAANAITTLQEMATDARNDTLDEIANKIAAMPGDTAASISIWVRWQKEIISAPHPQQLGLPLDAAS
jgi:hypothetical protein